MVIDTLKLAGKIYGYVLVNIDKISSKELIDGIKEILNEEIPN